jgi:putative Ca2+/H+ antiporter (TMEM165/GDT1 family)
VLLGGSAAHLLPIRWVKTIAAIGFAVMGVRLLWPEPNAEQTEEA